MGSIFYCTFCRCSCKRSRRLISRRAKRQNTSMWTFAKTSKVIIGFLYSYALLIATLKRGHHSLQYLLQLYHSTSEASLASSIDICKVFTWQIRFTNFLPPIVVKVVDLPWLIPNPLVFRLLRIKKQNVPFQTGGLFPATTDMRATCNVQLATWRLSVCTLLVLLLSSLHNPFSDATYFSSKAAKRKKPVADESKIAKSYYVISCHFTLVSDQGKKNKEKKRKTIDCFVNYKGQRHEWYWRPGVSRVRFGCAISNGREGLKAAGTSCNTNHERLFSREMFFCLRNKWHCLGEHPSARGYSHIIYSSPYSARTRNEDASMERSKQDWR